MFEVTLWQRGVSQLSREFFRLAGSRRAELAALLFEVGRLKEEIIALTDTADGAAVCAACSGACCRVGKYHPTPVDILGCIAAGELPVLPDFSSGACPFLGPAGCRIAPSRRPCTCVVFVCDHIEGRLSGGDLARLSRLEEELRCLGGETAARFGRRLAESFLLEMERDDRHDVPFLTSSTDGG